MTAPVINSTLVRRPNGQDTDLTAQVDSYIQACRQRIPTFIDTHYSWRGAWKLNRLAWGTDILVTPFNFVMGIPNFVLRVLAIVVECVGARRLAQGLLRKPLGIPTRVQETLTTKLMTDLLDLPLEPNQATDRVRHQVMIAARESLKIYVQTRNVAADITAGTLAALIGMAFLRQFTPGSVSAGAAIAHLVAKERAVSDFILGETLGRWYYAIFPVSPSFTVIVVVLLIVIATIAIVGAFSGMIHDPLQTMTGIHRRRLHRLLDTIEASTTQSNATGYRPKDTFFGRIYDLVDWLKGLLSF
jgi:hypothetical protein